MEEYQLIAFPEATRLAIVELPQNDCATDVGALTVKHGLIEKSLIPIPSSVPATSLSNHLIKK